MKRILPLLSLLAFALANPAFAAWTFVSGQAGDKEPTITDGSWTLKVYSWSTNPGFVSYTENGANGILDLSTIQADTTMVITSVDGTMRNGASYLKKVVMPDSVTRINEKAFQSCTLLEEVVFPNNLTFVGAAAFDGCSALATGYPLGTANPEAGTLLLPESLTTFDNWGTFRNCTSIRKVVARGLTTVVNRAFLGCTSLGEVEVSPNVVKICGNGTYWDNGAFYGCTALTNFSPTVFCASFESGTTGYYGPFAKAPIRATFDFSNTSIDTIPPQWNREGNLTGAIFPATLETISNNAFCWQQTGGAVFRFLGDLPSFGGSGDNTPFYPKNGTFGPKTTGTAYRHVFVVDAAAYPAWTNSAKFVKMSDVATSSIGNVKNYFSYESADFPTPDYPEETLGVTEDGSANGRYNWLVQYVDHSTVEVAWNDWDGTTLATTQVETGGYATYPGAVPTRASTVASNFVFAAWTPATNATVITRPTTFTATYAASLREHTITWQMDDLSTIDTTSVGYGLVPTHADASKASTAEYSYEFKGWSTDGSTVLTPIPAVTGPATYIAVFEQHDATTTATVSWFDEDGSTPLDPATTTVTKGLQPSHAEPTKTPTIDTAYTFDGWQVVGGDGTVIATANLPAVTSDIAYKAHYSEATRQYTITFADWDGSEISSAAYDYNTPAASVVEPSETPTRSATAEYSYAFAGWDAVIADVTADATYTATYDATPVAYTATFVNGQTSETISSADFAYGSPVTAPEPPVVEGYTFDAWVPAVSIMPASNITYTATYILNNYTITWMNADGALIDTTKVDHGITPTHAAAEMSSTAKGSYAFAGWEPAIEPAVSNTTYTAVYTRTVLTPMKLALRSMDYDKDSGEITIAASVVNGESSAVTEAGVASVPLSTGETSVTDSTNIVATLSGLNDGNGYEWTVSATQTIYGVTEVAEIYGRTWARREKDWFVSESVSWIEGAYAPDSASPAGQQVRLDATATFPAILPRALPDAAATQGVVVGIAAYQPNAGVAAAYYCWNGSEWVKLVGASPVGGVAVRIFGVVDFARKNGPAVAWYADGFQLTTESGEWEVPLAGGANLESFKRVGDFSVDSLAGDYDTGGLGFFLIVR